MEKKKVGIVEKLGFMGFSTSSNIVFMFKSLYYLSFLTMILKIDVAVAGIMVAVGTIWDAVNDPLIAIFCANHKFKSGETVRPYTLIACVPWAITIVLLFVNFHLTQSWTVVIGLAIYFLFEVLYTFLCMPYNSMASLATRDDGERKSINMFRSLGTCLGSGIGAVAILPLVRLFGGLTDHEILNDADSIPLMLTAIVMGVLCVAGSLFHYFTSKERVKPIDEEKPEEPKKKIGFFKAYKMLFKCKSWVLNMLFILCYAIQTTLVLNNVNYYAAYVLGNSSLGTPIQAVYLVMAIVGTVLAPIVDSKIGRKWTTVLSAAIMVIGGIPFLFLPDNLVTMCINAGSIGLGIMGIFVIFSTNRNNIADVLEAQNGRRMDALVAGGDNFITKLGEAATVELITIVFALTGMEESLGASQTPETVSAIYSMMGWMPMIVAAVMGFVGFMIDIPKELKEAMEKRNQVSINPNEIK